MGCGIELRLKLVSAGPVSAVYLWLRQLPAWAPGCYYYPPPTPLPSSAAEEQCDGDQVVFSVPSFLTCNKLSARTSEPGWPKVLPVAIAAYVNSRKFLSLCACV